MMSWPGPGRRREEGKELVLRYRVVRACQRKRQKEGGARRAACGQKRQRHERM